ncbi:zf-HC2 domain-containing protein [Filibacter tadaridae]|uniref:Anti-sigma-W factor RsiW n=1 Tax=Filibacter tadaridae TaxID=2483811 RepID=A0A3P5X556_9BACL|nr:zf-HC2 domain-containing protein [Filibacter tadaridae]VDC22404.1 Anti-sigma-W factor RsiW [Filibacter tadaridae]
MNTCPEKIIDYMHAYLDEDIRPEEERELQEHLANCSECKEIMDGLEESISFLKSATQIKAPAGFVDGVIARLPKEKSQVGAQRFLRRHPLLSAAAMFLLLMSATLFSSYGNDQHFSVSKQPNLVVQGETVLVPAGETIKGDIVVKNGSLRIEGQVEGDVTVIHGSKFMASTAIVTGESEEIDKAFDWLWYKIKNTVKDIFPSSKEDEKQEK